MQQPMFHPGSSAATPATDVWSKRFTQIATVILGITFGLLPILFIPSTAAPFGYSKVLLAVFAVTFGLLFFSLGVLREGTLTIRASGLLLGMWALAGVVTVAALFSGDFSDAFIGIGFGTQTAAFTILMAAVATAMTVMKASKASVIRLFSLLTVSAVLLSLFHIIRFVFGPNILSFGVLGNTVSTTVGAWNDLALFFGLVLILAMVALEQLPLTKAGRAILGTMSVLALFMLSVVNFFAVWLVLAGVSLIMLMYTLTKHRFSQSALSESTSQEANTGWLAVMLPVSVFVISVVFVIGGSTIGGAISKTLGFEFVQVTPSFSATFDIARSVYQDNAFVGVGPNKFVDAWRVYKDNTIMDTVYWNTPFADGNGFITTSFVNNGIFGILAWLAFLGLLIYSGGKMVFARSQGDRFWSFIATASFVASAYLWGMAFIYVPSTTMLLLTAVCTGVMATAYSVLIPVRSITLSVSKNRQAGFALVALVMIVIVGSVSVLYFTGRHYAALYSFNSALASVTAGSNIESVEQEIAAAYQISNNDIFARQVAAYQLARLNALLALPEPNETQVQQFQSAAVNGINAAQLATTKDPTEPLNWQILGQIYSALTVAGIEGSYERGVEAFERQRQYDPKSPVPLLLEAQLAVRNGDLATARTKANEAISKKRNYTEALVFLAELDIAEGNIDQAVSRTEAIVSLEPRNSARFYQLGLLYSAAGRSDDAIRAFSTAVSLDRNYANARYLLALLLAERGNVDEALGHLEVVRELNPGNAQLETLIAELRTNGALPSGTNSSAVVDPAAVISENGQVRTTEAPDTDLVTPVNTIPDTGEESEEAAETDEETATQAADESPATTTSAE